MGYRTMLRERSRYEGGLGVGALTPIYGLGERGSRLARLPQFRYAESVIAGEAKTPPMEAGRVCAQCPTVLSRWNEGRLCSTCRRNAPYTGCRCKECGGRWGGEHESEAAQHLVVL